MLGLRHFIFLGLMLFWTSGPTSAQSASTQDYVIFVDHHAIVCPASEADVLPPSKTNTECKKIGTQYIDPQNKHIWVFFDLQISDDMLDSNEPLGFGLSAKASSYIYINSREIGSNGQPADNKKAELVGRMDVVFPLREDVLVAGVNRVAIRMSSHWGLLVLRSPIHSVYVSPYEQPQSRMLRGYLPSLLPFGVFILGSLYFLIMSIVGKRRISAGLLSLMSALVACQLFAEVSRGLFSYTYPLHDIRLIAILLCSALFGICLSIYVVRIFGLKHQWRWFALIGLTIAISIVLPKGFDAKAGIALFSQTVLSLVVAIFYLRYDLVRAVVFSTVLSIFGAVNFIAQGQFLDIYFFYSIALLMLFLFAQQALAYGQEQAMRQEEEIRANKLQLVLDQRQEQTQSATLSLTESGKIHRIVTEDIISISGADDYIDVRLKGGKSRLISSTLAEMEVQLPSFFLRVHRSHIVNTNFIQSLDREPSGTGRLTLTQGNTIPVSRRIMPSVRKTLI